MEIQRQLRSSPRATARTPIQPILLIDTICARVVWGSELLKQVGNRPVPVSRPLRSALRPSPTRYPSPRRRAHAAVYVSSVCTHPDGRSLRLPPDRPAEDGSRHDRSRPAYAPSPTCCTTNRTTRGSIHHCRRRERATDDVQGCRCGGRFEPMEPVLRWASMAGSRRPASRNVRNDRARLQSRSRHRLWISDTSEGDDSNRSRLAFFAAA